MVFCQRKYCWDLKEVETERADVSPDTFTSSLSLGNIPENWLQEPVNLQKVLEFMKSDRV